MKSDKNLRDELQFLMFKKPSIFEDRLELIKTIEKTFLRELEYVIHICEKAASEGKTELLITNKNYGITGSNFIRIKNALEKEGLSVVLDFDGVSGTDVDRVYKLNIVWK